jgi:hypothetical protein
MKKNQQLAQLLLEIHEQWARDNGYRKIRKALDKAQASGFKHQASSNKHQAPSSESHKQQASSVKHKGSSAKPQASSSLIIDPGKSFTDL